MQTLEILANAVAGVIFLWLTYKAVCTCAATPSRCRLLRNLRTEFADQGRRLVGEVERLAGQSRHRHPHELATAIPRLYDWHGAAAGAGLPADYRPAEILHRIATARLAGDVDLAWDEYRHWLRRIAFDWPSRLSYGKQAKEFGLLFTVVGALLAFSNLSQVAEPFEVFGALSLAMLTTIVGLLLSLLASHFLVQRFFVQYRQLQIESEQTVLMVLRHLCRLPLTVRPVQTRHIQRKTSPTANAMYELPILYLGSPPGGNGGVPCGRK